MKADILGRADIELLVDNFYQRVLHDKKLSYIFNTVAEVNWSTHLPVMYDFWENIILCTGSYEGNPRTLHKHLQKSSPWKLSTFGAGIYYLLEALIPYLRDQMLSWLK